MITKETPAVAELEARYDEIAIVTDPVMLTTPDNKQVPRWQVVLRPPTSVEYKAYRRMVHIDTKRSEATEQMARKLHVLHARKGVESSSPTDFDALLERWPGISEACFNAIDRLAGMTGDVEGK